MGFFKPTGGVKPTFIQNQFGFAVGGPIRKDKMFFFGDYEGLRRVTRKLTFATIPTKEQSAGQFRNADPESLHQRDLLRRHHSQIV